jgi:putative transposase
METVHIYRLQPSKKLFAVLRDAQMEAAKVWNFCVETHKTARTNNTKWPGRNELQKVTKGGQFALLAQSVQSVTVKRGQTFR